MLGAVSQLSGLVDADALADALRRRLPAHIVELNLRALQLGRDYAALLAAAGEPAAMRRAPGVNVVIIVAGAVGLAVAAFFLVELVVDAVRRRQFFDIGVAGARRGAHRLAVVHLRRRLAAVAPAAGARRGRRACCRPSALLRFALRVPIT